MGTYLNPGNYGFQEILRSEYIDKTGLIALINETIETMGKLTCVSRPRRFGKSYAAKMLCAYYDYSCDSHSLFHNKEVARTNGYLVHMNQYHVINLDITSFISEARRGRKSMADIPNEIVEAIHKELKIMVPELAIRGNLKEDMIHCVERTGRKFVFIIDEWDALIREAKNNTELQSVYLSLLREWFKNSSFTPRVVAAAYITGILPIKKDGSQSAISDFREYTILAPGKFVEFTGFTESDVRLLCEKYRMNFEDVRQWYDGYDFHEIGRAHV